MGEGARHASVMLVGEQPGDKEDLAGAPVRRPRRAGARSGARARPESLPSDAYITNAVKHFRYKLRGKRRIHQTP